MSEKDLRHALEIAKAAAAEVGDMLLPHFGAVEAEAKHNGGDAASAIVTALDRQAEELLARQLAAFDPAVGFRGEEAGVRHEAEVTWLVDPLDGTSHFVRGMPFCTTMIALIDHGEPVLSVIYDIVRKDTYAAIKGQGAYRNDERISVSDRPLKQSFIVFESKLKTDEMVQECLALNKLSVPIRTINAGFEFAMLASGKIEARITHDPHGFDWDYAPGALLVREAGGVVCNLGKKTYDYRNHDFIAANPQVYQELTAGRSALFAAV